MKHEYIKVFVILILLVLNIAIYLNGQSLDPNRCMIEFKSQSTYERFGGIEGNNISISLQELYNNLQNGKCRVTWDKTAGYRLR